MTEKPTKSRKPYRATSMDFSAKTVTLADTTFRLSDLPADIVTRLALSGLKSRLVLAKMPNEEFADLVAGIVRMRAPKAERVSQWEKAIVAAIVEETKKTASPATPESAAEIVRGMSKKQKAICRQDPNVIKHHRKITGKIGGGVLTILSAPLDETATAA